MSGNKNQTWKIGVGGNKGSGSRGRGRGRGSGGRGGGRGGSSKDAMDTGSTSTRRIFVSNTSKSKSKVHPKKKSNRATKFAEEITMEIEKDGPGTMGTGKKAKLRAKKKEKKQVSKPLPKEVLKQLEQSMGNRWNQTDRSLNLTGLLQEPVLAQHNITRGWDNTSFCTAVVKVVEANCATVVTLNLANNGLTSLAAIRRLTTVAKDVVNLDISNNKLRVPENLGFFKGFEKIQRLRTGGNVNRFYKGATVLNKDKVLYERYVRRSFDDLIELDGNALTSALPVEIMGNYIPNPQTATVVQNFLLKYLGCLDEAGRPNITALFTPRSVFSITTPTNRGDKVSRNDPYMKWNRNLRKSKISNTDNLNRRLLNGAAILPAIKALPATIHDTANLVVDVWMATAALVCLNVSGKFKAQISPTEGSQKTVTANRLFHRVLMLVPAAANTPAAQHGWPATIVNEQLHITVDTSGTSSSSSSSSGAPRSAARLLSLANSSATTPSTPKPTIVTASSSNAQASSPVVDQQFVLAKFMELTKMNQKFALDCLGSNQWNGNAALQNFHQLVAHGKIPPEAYV